MKTNPLPDPPIQPRDFTSRSCQRRTRCNNGNSNKHRLSSVVFNCLKFMLYNKSIITRFHYNFQSRASILRSSPKLFRQKMKCLLAVPPQTQGQMEDCKQKYRKMQQEVENGFYKCRNYYFSKLFNSASIPQPQDNTHAPSATSLFHKFNLKFQLNASTTQKFISNPFISFMIFKHIYGSENSSFFLLANLFVYSTFQQFNLSREICIIYFLVPFYRLFGVLILDQ